MAKKTKTRVLLPGGIQALVHDLQNGGSQYGRQSQQLADNKEESASQAGGASEGESALQAVGSSAAGGRGGDVVAEPLPGQSRQDDARQSDIGQGAGGQTVAVGPSENAASQGGRQSDAGQGAGGQAAAVGPSENVALQGGRQPEGVAPGDGQNAGSQSGRAGGSPDGLSAAGAEVRQIDEKDGGQAAAQDAGQAAAAGQSAAGGGQDGADARNGATGTDDGATKEYHIVKDDSKDSWQLFLDMAKQYKDGNGKLATIYIDGTLKNVLDRMKYAGPEKLTTSAILSSIVARFVYDHEEDIRRVLFSGRLL